MTIASPPDKPRLVELPRFLDSRGNLSLIEEFRQVPFAIERAYWIYDVPGGEVRGGHAYHRGQEIIVALSGSFEVAAESSDGSAEVFFLNRSYNGVLIPPHTWRELRNFSTNSLALVLSSTPYDEADYIRERKEFDSMPPTTPLTSAPVNTPGLPDGLTPHSSLLTPNSKLSTLPTVFDCSILELPRITDRAGNITPVHQLSDIPFAISRVFYSYDIPGGESRGAHAHRSCHQLIVAASGSFDVVLDDGNSRRTVTLARPYTALHVPPGIWAAEQSFSSGSICLVIASHPYEETDYIRSYDQFRLLRNDSIS